MNPCHGLKEMNFWQSSARKVAESCWLDGRASLRARIEGRV